LRWRIIPTIEEGAEPAEGLATPFDDIFLPGWVTKSVVAISIIAFVKEPSKESGKEDECHSTGIREYFSPSAMGTC